jgi:hypothetical protein
MTMRNADDELGIHERPIVMAWGAVKRDVEDRAKVQRR